MGASAFVAAALICGSACGTADESNVRADAPDEAVEEQAATAEPGSVAERNGEVGVLTVDAEVPVTELGPFRWASPPIAVPECHSTCAWPRDSTAVANERTSAKRTNIWLLSSARSPV